MKTTGIVRSIDHLGRIVIPKEWRDLLRIERGDSMEMFMEGETVVLRKYLGPGLLQSHAMDLKRAVLTAPIDEQRRSEILAALRDLEALLGQGKTNG